MFAEHFIMPVLALIIGIISVFTDPKDKKKKWLIFTLIIALIIICILEINFKTYNYKKAEARVSWGEARMEELIKIINSFRSEMTEEFDGLTNLLNSFGMLKEKISEIKLADIQQSLSADKERGSISSPQTVDINRSITVEYFPKDVDPLIVEKALEELGFKLILRKPILPDIPTNSIWFGSSVPTDAVKLVSYTLIRAGIRIKAIRPFRSSTDVRASLIQIGGDASLISAPALTVEEIRSTSQFKRVE